MFRCSLDELVDTLINEFPIPMPGMTGELTPDFKILLDLAANCWKLGQPEAMGVTWTRQTILLTDADTFVLTPYKLLRDEPDFPHRLFLMRLRVDEGKAIFGFVPQRLPRNADAIGRHKVTKEIMYRASDTETATKLALIGPGLGQSWLDQFKKN